MKNIDEVLKDAICNSDIIFLGINKDKYNIDHRFKNENNDTLLMYAISDEKTDVYNFFLKNKANTSLVNDEGENIIHSIVYSGDANRLKIILDNYKLDVNKKSLDGTTPLLLSVLLGKFEIFDFLLDNKADVNLFDNEHNSPLHVACSLGYIDMVYKLIELGANLKLKTNKGNFPLALAINAEHHVIVKFLFEKIYCV